MAEIKIEQKTYVVVITYHRCIVCIFFGISITAKIRGSKNQIPSLIRTNQTSRDKENNNTVAAYVDFVENNQEKNEFDHEYTNEAL
jgi:hypothetical protein